MMIDYVLIRPADSRDQEAIDAIREPFYRKYGRGIDEIPGLPKWLVAEKGGTIVACVALLDDFLKNQRTAVDLYGTDAEAGLELLGYIERQAKEDGVQLIGWMAIENHHQKLGMRRGWRPRAVLYEFEGGA